MITFFVLSSAAILLIIALVHVYWAVGGRWGAEAVIPRTKDDTRQLFTPGTAGTMLVALLLLSAAYLLMAQGGYLSQLFPPALLYLGCAVCAAVFVLRAVGDFRYIGFFKKMRHTRFAHNDTWLYSPLCLWLGLSFVLALL
ncbi:DUF3995 domain-containing protein [Brevibacillus sp. NRS-1366]|uniref:DUF3995 domain-containing protein n=1 Tax=Brevibacillus sp. NRS-1366 TaxID=3233899 RepID=UPI003D234EE0